MPPASSAERPTLSLTGQWRVWQLIDSAFPTGGFAHSAGLEAAWQHGEVRDRDELIAFAEASLDQLGHAGLPFVMAAFEHPEQLPDLDRCCETFTINHVANRASRAQGRAFFSAMERIFSAEFAAAFRQPAAPIWPPFGHFSPVFGAGLRSLHISAETVQHMFFFNHLRSVLAAAVRLNIIGPMEAQRLTHVLSPRVEAILKSCEKLTVNELSQTAPLLDLWQGAQDRLYSRLFQS